MKPSTKLNLDQYQFTVRPLSKDEGGGYQVEYPDLPGCMSDGETVEEAISNGREALRDCLEAFKESGRKRPQPTIEAAQWRQRVRVRIPRRVVPPQMLRTLSVTALIKL